MNDTIEKYSYSKLDTYKSCPFKYKLQYVDKQSCFIGNIATDFGSAIHEAEQAIAEAIVAKEQINYTQIKNNLILKFLNIEQKYADEYLKDDGKSNRNYRDKAYEYLEVGVYKLEQFMKAHPTYEIVGIEQRFNFVYDDSHSFNGAIDRVFHDTATDKYIIQDIKSWAVPKDTDELATPLQFVVYVLAAKELWGATPEQITCQYYLPLVNFGLIQDCCTAGYMTRGVTKIATLFKSIATGEYTPKPSTLCHWCNYCPTNKNTITPYKYMCPYFMKWTKEHPDFSKENKWDGIENHDLIVEAYHKKYNISL